MKNLYLLFECSAGYFLLKVEEWEQIGNSENIEKKILNADIFHQIVKFCSFISFETAERALENLVNINEGKATKFLLNFLEQNLPSNKNKYMLGIADLVLGKFLSNVGFQIIHNNNILELFRACRYYYLKKISYYINNEDINIKNFNIGLGHSYSRSKLKLDPRKQDKSIINCISTIESLDKDINLFSMRVIEWYSWHFPELKKVITDIYMYCKLVNLIKIKENFDFENNKEKIYEITKNEDITNDIQKIANLSIGQELTDEDLNNILNFSNEVINLLNTRNILWNYLDKKLNIVSPNLKELLGNTLSARLISHAGSLVNLAKCPSSSIQIFGSEKALFNSLKGNKKTPKFGILYNSSYISKTPLELKGRMSRYLSCKCAMAARIDSFSDVPTNSYGIAFKKQLEHKILHMVKGVKLSKNIDYIKEAESIHNTEKAISEEEKAKKKLKKIRKEEKKKKKKKKKKKEEEVDKVKEEKKVKREHSKHNTSVKVEVKEEPEQETVKAEVKVEVKREMDDTPDQPEGVDLGGQQHPQSDADADADAGGKNKKKKSKKKKKKKNKKQQKQQKQQREREDHTEVQNEDEHADQNEEGGNEVESESRGDSGSD
ncbi:pre-RNA processing ribonucleoprotein, putative [Plasmodium ovale wallikeri]|uniref:Nucleolar protein 56 n=1 Tax=Plasmodium ovale wallikeri TaxID=864142 RepID=A0A1A8YUG5_PLAOA|nr:pre-RNA processing ribonucleoprotein, putative [Plasmodium ovale wallikeri]SBT35603.1 pre-RNA processing ribonucleoprotein, putative [Plasmodium ovale wallikeri]